MRILPSLRLLTIALIALVVAPASAHAALPITFEGFANGTQIDDEYTASDGVTFLADAGSTGLPQAQDVGTKANSGSVVALSQCSGCEFVHNVIKGRFATSQEAVSVRVGINSATPANATITLEALNFAGTSIGSTSAVASSADFKTLLSLDPAGTDNVVFFRVMTTIGGEAGYQFGIDDVNAVDGGASAPDVALATASNNLRLRQGGSIDVPINLFRVNGSNGDVTLSALSLPTGVSASFTPNPVAGTSEGPSTLTLSAANNATLVAADSITVRGTPADAFSGSGPSDLDALLTVEPSFTVGVPDPIRVPSCGSTTVNVNVQRAFSGFTGTVHLAASGLPAGYTASFATPDVGPPSGGAFVNQVPLTITKVGSGDMSPTSITVTGSSTGLLDSADSASIQRFAGEVTGITESFGVVPRDTDPGSEVTITGRGFCVGSTVQFGNSFASVTPAGADITGGNTQILLRVPRLATSGPVTVVAPDGTFASATSLPIRSPRNSEGFQFENYGGSNVSFDDLKYVYGEAQTNITLDVCWPFGCNVVTPIPSPFAALYQVISNAALAGKGSCYGMSVTSQQLMMSRVPFSRFSPSGATSVWQLSGSTGPSPALAKHIRAWHSTQLSSEGIQDYVRIAASNAIDGGSHMRGRLEGELAAGHSPLIMVKNGSSGHVVVAMDLRSEGSGYVIDTYDPNIPFATSEDSNGTQHRDRSDASAIHVAANGDWTFRGAFASQWSGSSGDIVDLPFSEIPVHPTMPSTLSGFLSLIVPFASSGAAHTTQITDANGNQLLAADGTLNTNPASDVPGAQVMPSMSGDSSTPIYLVPSNGSYTQRLEGDKSGTAQAGMIGPGFGALVSGIGTSAGKAEAIAFDSKHGEVQIDASKGGQLRARLAAGDKSGTELGADVRIGGADAGTHEVGISKRTGVHVDNGGGAATVAMTLTYANKKGTPGSLTLPKVNVPSGGSVDARPSWAKLGTAGAVLTVRSARGKVVSRRVVRARAPRWVRSAVARATTTRGRNRVVRVTARYAAVPRSATAFVTIKVMRGTRLVATRRLTVAGRVARGRKAYGFRLVLPKGRYVIRAGVAVVSAAGGRVRTSSMRASTRFVAR
jgi:hypothetical protein